ncbi:MAG: low molecular weight phosphotyrosine protein phosphatase [Firmicutes bacterium]|nr:low molecular weight phosphotyrosine protein phosphatase [Bacillota bacterium]
MPKILFVCHGNICRSPMAEYVMKSLAAKAGVSGDWEIASAAVSREELGNPVYPPARRELASHGISCAGHAARQITARDLQYYDRIYYMDSSNYRALCRMFGSRAEKCRPLLPYSVADPWYTGDFSQTWEDIWAGCTAIMEELTC